MNNQFTLVLLLATTSALAQTDRVGINTTTPRAGLDLSHNDGLVATGTLRSGNTADLPTGAGTRLMWIPRKAAFRAGYVDVTQWNDENIGLYSVAIGFGAQADGESSTALGNSTTASGASATALGFLTNASGVVSTALGNSTTASGGNSTAMGAGTTASGFVSTALGNNVSTNDKFGSFIIGDGTFPEAFNARNSDVNNQFKARFTGGYVLLTDNSGGVGAKLDGGQSSWSVISDSTKKEGFRPADGQAFLRKIAAMRLGSWNYRGQDAKTFRHYGPMAQDFFAAFGHDGIGTIGCDTLINQADFDGVNLIAIKALIQENEARKAENLKLQTENADLRRLLGQVVADVQALKAQATATASR